MIPDNLKNGAVVRCITKATDLPVGLYTVVGYKRKPSWGTGQTGVLIAGYPNAMDGGDQGWTLHRFDLVCDGDGSDYQGLNDVDLRRAEPCHAGE